MFHDDLQRAPSFINNIYFFHFFHKLLRVLWLFIVDLALMSYECEAPETQFEKERRKSLRLVNRLGLYAVVFIYSQIFLSFELKVKYCPTFFFFLGGGGAFV